MGKYFRFVRSIFDTKYSCRDLVKSAEEVYAKHQREFPGLDPHSYLAQTWLAFKAAQGANPEDEDFKMASFTSTYLLACIPPDKCARALGIYILYKERPEDLQKLPDLLNEFNEVFIPVMEAQKNGRADELYQRYNPNMKKAGNGQA